MMLIRLEHMVYLSDLKGQEFAYGFFLFCIYAGVVFDMHHEPIQMREIGFHLKN